MYVCLRMILCVCTGRVVCIMDVGEARGGMEDSEKNLGCSRLLNLKFGRGMECLYLGIE